MATIKMHLEGRVRMCTVCGFFPRKKPELGCPECGANETMIINSTNATAIGIGLAAERNRAAGRVAA